MPSADICALSRGRPGRGRSSRSPRWCMPRPTAPPSRPTGRASGTSRRPYPRAPSRSSSARRRRDGPPVAPTTGWSTSRRRTPRCLKANRAARRQAPGTAPASRRGARSRHEQGSGPSRSAPRSRWPTGERASVRPDPFGRAAGRQRQVLRRQGGVLAAGRRRLHPAPGVGAHHGARWRLLGRRGGRLRGDGGGGGVFGHALTGRLGGYVEAGWYPTETRTTRLRWRRTDLLVGSDRQLDLAFDRGLKELPPRGFSAWASGDSPLEPGGRGVFTTS